MTSKREPNASDTPRSSGPFAVGPTLKPIQVVLILALVGLVAVYVGTEMWKRTTEAERGAASPVGAMEPGAEPEPWEYDEQRDMHWDPRPGHQHWHHGPPPEGVAPPEPPDQAGDEPEPWEYDEQRDMHWDPRPGHQHWHHGPPPPEDARQ